MKYHKGFKVRIYPTKEQEKLMFQHIGACRWIWNHFLEEQIESYKAGKGYIREYDMINMLTSLKNDGEHDWLYNISGVTQQIICRDLNKAYIRFFEKISEKPKFKSRKKAKKLSFPVDQVKTWFDNDGFVHIIKLGKIKYKTDFILPKGTKTKFTNTRIANQNGKWILSFGLEIENQDFPKLNDDIIGIDLGIKELAIVSFLEKPIVFHNINKSREIRRLKHKLKHLNRKHSRQLEANKIGDKYVSTKNIQRTNEQIRRVNNRITGIRDNYIHQITHYIATLLPKRIVMEDLNVKGMMKNRCLAGSIQDQKFYEFRRQMQHKCELYGIEFVLANRYFPSSKMCSCCKNIKKSLTLSDRTYVCENCGFTIDRDFNAALNLARYEV